MQVEKKWIVITGAAGGIGQALCKKFISEGAFIFALDRHAQALAQLKKQLLQEGGVFETRLFDVTQTRDYEKLNQILKKEKNRPAIWINNAGIALPSPFKTQSQKTFNHIMDVNFRGTVMGTRFALELMSLEHSGLIVNVASVSGHIPSPFISAYSSSKHAIVGLTRSLAMELKLLGSPVKTLLVSPAFCDTPIMLANPDIKVPQYMKSSPEMIANAIFKGITSGAEEIYPGRMAFLLLKTFQFFPKGLFLASRIFGAKSFREALGIEALTIPRGLS